VRDTVVRGMPSRTARSSLGTAEKRATIPERCLNLPGRSTSGKPDVDSSPQHAAAER
jgi:hypothetical protein